MKISLILGSLFFYLTTNAAPLVDMHEGNPVSTNDSQVDFKGILPAKMNSNRLTLHFDVLYADSMIDSFSAQTNADRSFQKRISLDRGRGVYTVILSYHDASPPDESTGEFDDSFRFTVTNTDPKDETNLLPSGQVESDDPEIQALSAKIILHASATTDLAKAKAIHDWVSTHITYASPGHSTALGTLHTGSGVCVDYANLFAALARAAGLPTQVIDGTGIASVIRQGPHTWNKVWVAGQWITVDTTWDAVYGEKYFNMDLDTFSKNHIPY